MIRSALLLLAILMTGCQRTPESDPAAATKAFFQHLTERRLETAFRETAFAFQHTQTSRDFEASVLGMGLDGCEILQADPPTIAGDSAKQAVEVRTNFDAHGPLVISLIREHGVWRVFTIKSAMDIATGISENHFTRIGKGAAPVSVLDNPLPDERTAMAMAKETMLRFHDAIQQKSFEEFYDGVARAWQRQLTLGMLSRTFQGFIDSRTKLIAIKDREAVLQAPPHIDPDGLLTIAGRYMTQPERIDFEIKYIYELPNWRPFGVSVQLIK